jgi:hypothetical protein
MYDLRFFPRSERVSDTFPTAAGLIRKGNEEDDIQKDQFHFQILVSN